MSSAQQILDRTRHPAEISKSHELVLLRPDSHDRSRIHRHAPQSLSRLCAPNDLATGGIAIVWLQRPRSQSNKFVGDILVATDRQPGCEPAERREWQLRHPCLVDD